MRPTATQLILLPMDLGLLHPTDAQIIQLSHFLSMAATAIERAGIQLSADVPADDMLLAMYAAWLYRKRIQGPDGSGMPMMLRAELNDRKIAAAGGDVGDLRQAADRM